MNPTPKRCIGGRNGPHAKWALSGSDYCRSHGGQKPSVYQKDEQLSTYKFFNIGDTVKVPDEYGGYVSTITTVSGGIVYVKKVEGFPVRCFTPDELKKVPNPDPLKESPYTKAIEKIDAEISSLMALKQGLEALRASKW